MKHKLRTKKQFHKSREKRSVSGLFLAPSLVGVLIFYVLPFLVVIYYSFVDNPISKNFVWFNNYVRALSNHAFSTAFGNTWLFSIVAVPCCVGLSLLLALLLDSGIPARTQLRSSFLTPLMVPTASVVLIWQVLFDYKGVVNAIVSRHGGDPVDWLGSSAGFLAIILLFFWKNIGYNMVLFLAALGNVPKDAIEVAELDGAGKIKIFFLIKLRYLSPMLLFTTILSIINSFKVFREVYLLTGDYPVGTLYMLQHYMNNTFASGDYQKLSTAAIYMSLLMIVVIGLLFLFEHHIGKDIEEE